MTTAESSSPAVPPRFLSLLHTIAAIVLALGLGLVSGLYLLTFFPALHRVVNVPFLSRPDEPNLGLPVALSAILLTPLAMMYAAHRLPRSARGLVWFVIVAAATLVVNLSIVAWVPSVRDQLFGRVLRSYSLLALAGVLFFGLGIAAWRWLRPVTPRAAVKFGLGVAALVTLGVCAVAYLPALRSEFLRLAWPGGFDDRAAIRVLAIIGLFAVTPLLVFGVAGWRRWTSWRWIAAGYLALAPVLAYLATDDPVIRRPVTIDEIAPAFPGAEASHAVLMRYGKNQAIARNFQTPNALFANMGPDQAFSLDSRVPEKWVNWLTSHRGAIDQAWADLAPVRAWWNELNTFDRIGDLTPARPDGEFMAFGPPRLYSQMACAIAGLQALDGDGDAAVDTLLPVLQVGRKLQPSSRTLVRFMIAVVIERMSLATAGFILDRAGISPGARARLIAALEAPGGGVAGARRIVAMEYTMFVDYLVEQPLGGLMSNRDNVMRPLLNALSPFVYNPRKTANLYGDYVAAAQEHMAQRQFDRIDREFIARLGRPRFKNFVGSLLFGWGVPAYTKIGESYWKTQDDRAALLGRLRQG